MSGRCVARLSTIHRPWIYSRPLLACFQCLPSATVVRDYSSWRRSPKVKDAERWRKRHGVPQQTTPQKQWPLSVMQAAYSSGGLPISPGQATEALEAFDALTKYNRPAKSALLTLCKDYNMEPMTLTILARILLKTGGCEHFPLVRELLLSASALDDEAATIMLVHQAVETNKMRHPDIVAPRAHLIRLAEAGNPAAMALQAELLAAQGQLQRALLMSEEAARTDTDEYTGLEAVGDTKRKVWSTLAKLRKQNGDIRGARVALEKGAFEHDDPWAYYFVANTYRKPSDPEYLRFMLKAAVSGIPDAANKLGQYYLGIAQPSRTVPKDRWRETRETSPRPALFAPQHSKRERHLLAIEWFSVSTEHPTFRNIDESRVYLSLLLRGQGEHEHGQRVLQRARGSEVYGPNAVPWLLERWYGTQDFLTVEFLTQDMEKVIYGEMDE